MNRVVAKVKALVRAHLTNVYMLFIATPGHRVGSTKDKGGNWSCWD